MTWVTLSIDRARIKDKTAFMYDPDTDPALITQMNSELRLIASIQEEVRRTREEMESR